jgi:hypothetical protein
MCNRLHHCVPLVEMVKNIYGTSNLGSGRGSYASEKNICLGYQYFRSVLPVRNRNFRWLVEEGVVLCENELPVLSVRDQNFRWGPEVPVEPDRKFR